MCFDIEFILKGLFDMGVLSGLQPEAVFKYFEEICSIPHGSGNVEKISNYLVDFAKEHGFRYRQDENFNVVIFKEASKGYEDHEPVILQGHMDMVCVKNSGCAKDMEKEGLDLVIDGDYIKAVDTTLGGDDGIAVAYAMAALTDETIAHPPLEVIVTVDEEVGMLGAAAIELPDIKGHVMLNMDSEEEGIFLSSCAGGATACLSIKADKEDVSGTEINIKVSGLTSGHSGVDIIYQRANANVVMGRILFVLSQKVNLRIASISGGEKDNSIAPFANASIIVSEDEKELAIKLIEETAEKIKKEYAVTDAGMVIEAEAGADAHGNVYNAETTSRIILALTHIPDGVIRMSNDIKGLVQTSLNLGVVKEENEDILLTYLLRSSVESEKEYLIARIQNFAEVIDCNLTISGTYPAWEYKQDSRLRGIMSDAYEKLSGKKPQIQAIHAGVECGMIAEKVSDLDCVSFGPEILDIHTPKERLSISSVERTWKLVLEVLKNL